MKKMSLHTAWSEMATAARLAAARQVTTWRGLSFRWRFALVSLASAVVLALGMLLSLDWSRQLTPAELQGLEAWSADTHAAEVAMALQRVKGDNKVTVEEANGVIEAGKAAPLRPGMMEPVGWK